MTEEKKQALKKALITFVKACIPPFVALISSVLTTVLGGDVGTSTAVGSALGVASGIIAHS